MRADARLPGALERHPYFLSDVFTDRPFGGNPLAVFPEGQRIDPALMQRIAKELNLSETVFVLPPDDPRHTARIRIFTPASELPFAGHPTVGTACTLLRLGHTQAPNGHGEMTLEEGVGPVRVEVQSEGHRTWARFTTATLPVTGPAPPSRARLAALLSLDEADILNGDDGDGPGNLGRLGPQAVSCGVPFLFVPVTDRRALQRVRLNPSVWTAELAASWAPHVYVLTEDAELAGSAVRVRMFAPAMGIPEDPATGGAAAALPGYLAPRQGVRNGTLRWRIEQGFEMGRPSLIDVEADLVGGGVAAVRVAGESVALGQGWLDLPRTSSAPDAPTP